MVCVFTRRASERVGRRRGHELGELNDGRKRDDGGHWLGGNFLRLSRGGLIVEVGSVRSYRPIRHRGKLSDILNGSGSDFNDRWNATAAAGEFGPVPRGVDVCHATKGELESSRSKSTPGYQVEFTVIDGDFQGRKLWLDCWLTPAALPQSKRDLAKLGITSPAQLEQPLPKWIRCNVTSFDPSKL